MSDYEAWDAKSLEAADLRLVRFVGGTLNGQVRLHKGPVVEGDRYTKLVPFEEVWEYNGDHYELVGQ